LKKLILILAITMLPSAVLAADSAVIPMPHWSLEVKAGDYAPATENWTHVYGRRDMPEYAGTLAYKLTRQLEVGAGAGYMTKEGPALAPSHGTLTGNVTYWLYPVNVFVLYRGIFSETQWLVPYVGGGYTRMYYKQKIEDQDTRSGAANGYHARAGLQFALDGLDVSAANNLYMDFGVYHTYFFIEAEYTKARVKETSAELGGTAYLGGLLFEF
jgi:hypothetical protein